MRFKPNRTTLLLISLTLPPFVWLPLRQIQSSYSVLYLKGHKSYYAEVFKCTEVFKILNERYQDPLTWSQ